MGVKVVLKKTCWKVIVVFSDQKSGMFLCVYCIVLYSALGAQDSITLNYCMPETSKKLLKRLRSKHV